MTYADAAARCWLEVDLDVICENFRSARQMLTGNAFPIPVLKANAYGMNAVIVAQALKAEGARLFAVATTDEAEQLLGAVPDIEVLSMGLASEGAMRRLIRRGMPLTLYSKKQGETLRAIAREENRAARVHVKIDTGLHRLGFEPDGAAETIVQLCEDHFIEPVGLFTHLAIHTPQMDARQIQLLLQVKAELAQRGINIPLTHAVDSIGMARYPENHLDAARIGAWLYGVSPRNAEAQCRTPARFKARVSQLHFLRKGELIGYDDDHPIARDSIVATVSAGYVDGTPRKGEGWQVEVRGQRADVLGIACMDQLMIDVSDIAGVQEGDVVTFVGGIIGIDEYAQMGALNRNEAWARIGRRVPRVFYRDGKPVQISTEL